jgi:hypothetical protein
MTVYTASSGAIVFATGSMNFNWGLDGYNAPALHPNYVNAAAQQMTRNVLAAMQMLPIPSTPTPTVTPKHGSKPTPRPKPTAMPRPTATLGPTPTPTPKKHH